MTIQSMENTNRPIDPYVAAKLWRKVQQKVQTKTYGSRGTC